jgi:ribosome recycling factor
MAMPYKKDDLKKRMDGAMDAARNEFTGLRTGRASVHMLEHVQVEAYGSRMPINQCGSVTVPEPRLLNVQVWDASIAKHVEKAIREAGLGLNPVAEGNLIRVPVPQLTEERRKELSKVAGKYAENARVAIRNIRRDGMDMVKKDKSDGLITEDDVKRLSDEVQKLTDEYTGKVDVLLAEKEKDIMTV